MDNQYLELAKRRLKRIQKIARGIQVPSKAELDKISLTSPQAKQSNKNLDCQF